MSRDDENLPDNLQRDLHGILPDLPAALHKRETSFLHRAHREMRGAALRRWLTAGSLAAAAALAIGITIWQSQPTELPPAPIASIQQSRPTIIDAMLAARRGAKPAEVDQIAMAAVRLDGEVQ